MYTCLACSPTTELPTALANELDTYVYVPTAADEVFAVEDVREENVVCHAPSPPPPRETSSSSLLSRTIYQQMASIV